MRTRSSGSGRGSGKSPKQSNPTDYMLPLLSALSLTFRKSIRELLSAAARWVLECERFNIIKRALPDRPCAGGIVERHSSYVFELGLSYALELRCHSYTDV